MTDEQTLFTWAEFVLNSKTTWYKKTLHTFINLLRYCYHFIVQTQNFSPGPSPLPVAFTQATSH